MRNFFSKKIYVKRQKSETWYHPLPLPFSVLQLAWGKAEKKDKEIRKIGREKLFSSLPALPPPTPGPRTPPLPPPKPTK